MRRIFQLLVSLVIFLSLTTPVLAQQDVEVVDPGSTPQHSFEKGRIIEVVSEETREAMGQRRTVQTLKVKIDTGSEVGKEVEVEFVDPSTDRLRAFKVGERVVLAKVSAGEEEYYDLVDRYRMPAVYGILIAFIALVLIIARGKGFTALVGMVFSIFVVKEFIVPRILFGSNPLLVTAVGVAAIVILGMYVAHGFSKRTSISVISTLAAAGIGLTVAELAVYFTRIFGVAKEEANFVQSYFPGIIDLKSLLMAGILITLVGVLDDVVTTQTTAAEELKKADPSMNFKQLFSATYKVGREHIVALINTMFLVFTGVGLPLFLLFSVNSGQPAWLLLNSEFVIEEIVRALSASTGLIVAVPIATLLAAWFYSRQKTQPIATEEVVVVEEITVTEVKEVPPTI